MGAERTLYERVRFDGDAVACLVQPQVVTAGSTWTPTIDMGGVPGAAAVRHESYDEVVFCIMVGAAQASTCTLDVEALESLTAQAAINGPTASARTFASGAKAIGTLTAGTGYAALNLKYLIFCRADELDVDNLYRYIQLHIDVGGADGETFLLAVEADRSTASDEAVTSTNIAEIVV